MVLLERTVGVSATALEESRVKDDIKRIQEYVWARHIDGSDKYDHSITDEAAIRILDGFYSEIGNRNNPDQVYLGILLFENAFGTPERQTELFERAKRIFEFYRRVTGEEDWTPVEDRLADIHSFLEEQAAAAAAAAPKVAEAPVAESAVAAEERPAAAVVAPAVPAHAPAARVETAPPAPMAAPTVGERILVPTPTAAEDEARRRAEEHARKREATEAFIADLEVVDGMLLVPAGTFRFGAEGKELFLDTFYIDRYPVTNAEYMRFVRETGYRPTRYVDQPKRNRPNQPVVGVSYADAAQYAKWAGKSLPTEEQWEKAARGTDGRPFPWGNDPPGQSDACFGLDPVEGAPTDVGQTLRNVSPFGVHDMCGGVWEWTSSRSQPGSEYVVVRGGCYNDPIEFLRLDYRLEAHPKDKCEAIGFRCVRNVHH